MVWMGSRVGDHPDQERARDMVWDLCLQCPTRTLQKEEPLHPVHRRVECCARQAKALRLFFLRNHMLFPFGSVKDPQGIKQVEEMG